MNANIDCEIQSDKRTWGMHSPDRDGTGAKPVCGGNLTCRSAAIAKAVQNCKSRKPRTQKPLARAGPIAASYPAFSADPLMP